ncbi:MAG: hypothetical protein L6R38_009571 [Xanthoria sp. 2 TBL-2021]|nr:MAG: hypothetical protein L6R38_009571 [Xanthoria sp. 2 TBL-2021]
MIVVRPPPDAPHLHSTKASTTEDVTPVYETKMDLLGKEVQDLHERHLRVESLLALSDKLQAEFTERLQSGSQCMLPSHNYTLPNGKEHGTYLALEVGGSTLRVALVDLNGRASTQPLRIRRIVASNIDNRVRDLRGLAFFDWIAAKIREMLLGDREARDRRQSNEPLPMGIAWAFPIDQTSIRSGNIIGMGKGFNCSTYKGSDLGDLITEACQRLNLNIRLDAIVNDSSAAVLSCAYIDPSTRLAVILGTGLNAAVHLPVSCLDESKFGSRQFPSTANTTHVLVNTELSMFGKDAFPTTPWDEDLNAHHILPDYQPLEYLLAGKYMGEIVRLVLVEATETCGLFNGKLPSDLSMPFSLETRILATIEADFYPHLNPARFLRDEWTLPGPPTPAEMHFIRQVVLAVSRRSQGYFTAAIHALSYLLRDVDDSLLRNGLDHISIGCDGSVINKYPGYMEKCQLLLDEMVRTDGTGQKRVVLDSAGESAVLGAGVAVAMANAAE